MEKLSCGKKRKTIDDAVEIGVEEGGLYKLKGHAYSILAVRARTSTVLKMGNSAGLTENSLRGVGG